MNAESEKKYGIWTMDASKQNGRWAFDLEEGRWEGSLEEAELEIGMRRSLFSLYVIREIES